MNLPPNEAQYEKSHISDDETTTAITAVSVCFFVAFIAMSLRLISRRLTHQYLQRDDYMAILALAFIAGLAAVVGTDLYAGLGKHIILSNHTTRFSKSNAATQLLYITALIPLKLSLIFLYRRLSTSKPLSLTLWILGIWVVIAGIVSDLVTLLNCAQAPAVNYGAQCINYEPATLFQGGQDVLTNLVLLCLSIPLIWHLRMDRVRLVHLAGIFVLGGFACAASIIRLVYVSNASLVDPTWSSTAPTIWSTVEVTMGLTAIGLAPLTPLIHYILPSYSPSPSHPRTSSFLSDTETAVALSTVTSPESSKRTRKVSFKDAPSIITINKESRWARKSTKMTGSGASSPGFTWRCSGRPEDLERWKALPPSPPLSPEQAHLLENSGGTQAGIGAAAENLDEVAMKNVLFRAVHYGGSI